MKRILLLLMFLSPVLLQAQYPVIDGQETFAYEITERNGDVFHSSITYKVYDESGTSRYSYISQSSIDRWEVETREDGVPNSIRFINGEGEILLTFNGAGEVEATGEWKGKTVSQKESFSPDISLENAMFIRTMDLAPGSKRSFELLQADRFPKLKSFEMFFEVVGREKISVPAGTFDCVKVFFSLEGSASAFFKSHYYVTDDSRRIIVKMDNIPLGGFMELTEISR